MILTGIGKATDNLHAFFIPAKYRQDDEVYRKCKIFINTTLLTSLFALFFLGNAILFEMPKATAAMITCVLLFFSFAWMLKYGVPFRVCTNSYIALGMFATAWDAYWAGGLNSIHTPWFVFPAIGAILIGTVKEGRTWLIISVAFILAFGLGALLGYQFPNELADKYHDAMQLSGLAGLIVILFLVVLVVEKAYQNSLKKLEAAMDSLRRSQEQLIHQERLALLGQMIAGIAHEIQNPLNFVNNFSSVSRDLLGELKDAKTEEERENALQLLSENLGRIELHGKRVDTIVKEMLMHSRTSPGEKQLSDINKICEEAMTYAYQNMKSTNPNFAGEVVKEYAPAALNAKVIPQEISRVVLNLLDNAFYSVNQKHKQGAGKNGEYTPAVSLLTKMNGHHITIIVKDNGAGISQQNLDSIFQPFFTTKPAREGTGLGLSISYDIVKAHGGEIVAKSKENEFAEFTVTLPV
jgi:signal transduction histidine kinase